MLTIYSHKLNTQYLLWFQKSNQYLIVSEVIKDIIDLYNQHPSESPFKERLKQHQQLSEELAKTYYQEIKLFLEEAGKLQTIPHKIDKLPEIPEAAHKCQYKIGDQTITVNYGSERLKSLIHPQRAHLETYSTSLPSVIFDIFEKDNFVFLFKNSKFVGHYASREYHLLQGNFSLEIINTIYNKTEADWVATFHASTVCNKNEAVMLIGASGNGKSTFSALLMAAGYDLLADDFTPLSASDGQLYRVPSAISIKEGAFGLFANLIPGFEDLPVTQSTSKTVPLKYIAPRNDFAQSPQTLPCNKIVYTKYDANANTTLERVPIENILQTLIPESWISPLESNALLFMEWVKHLECYELHYSDNAQAKHKFESLLSL